MHENVKTLNKIGDHRKITYFIISDLYLNYWNFPIHHGHIGQFLVGLNKLIKISIIIFK